MKSANRIPEADYLRGFAVLTVMLDHCTKQFQLPNLGLATTAFNIGVHYAVPLFCVISGLVLSEIYGIPQSLRSFYYRRFQVIMPPYFIFSFLYWLFFFVMETEPSKVWTLPQIVLRVLTGGAFHLWFLQMIAQFYLVYPALIRGWHIIEKRHVFWGSVIALGCSLTVQVLWNLAAPAINYPVTEFFGRAGMSGFVTQFIPSHLFYFALGIYLGRNRETITNMLLHLRFVHLLCASIVLTFAGALIANITDSSVGASWPWAALVTSKTLTPIYYLFVCLLVYAICLKPFFLKSIFGQIVKTMGKYSFGIYLIHVFFLDLLIRLTDLTNIADKNWIYSLVLFVAVGAASLAATRTISFMPYSELALGHNLGRVASSGNYGDLEIVRSVRTISE